MSATSAPWHDACLRIEMHAIELLKKQHRDVEQLFRNLDIADDPTAQAVLFASLASKLVAHDRIERDIFYPICEDALGLVDRLGDSVVEHGVVEFSLFEADEALGTDDFRFKIRVLKELVRNHVMLEEGQLFPEVEKAMSKAALDSLGADLEEAFNDAMTESYRSKLFENLRQVLATTLRPKPLEEADEDRAEPSAAERPSGVQRSFTTKASTRAIQRAMNDKIQT